MADFTVIRMLHLVIQSFAQEASTAQDSNVVVVGTGLIALLIVVGVWRVTKLSITTAHEGGHALMGSIFGGAIGRIRLNRDGSGVTPVALVGLGFIAALLAGYLGPSFFGLLGAMLLVHGHADAVLWLGLLFLLIMLFKVGNLFGAFVVLVLGALVFLVAQNASPAQQTVVAYTWVWILLLGGFRDVIGLHQIRENAILRGTKDTASDAYQLRKATMVPAPIWVGVFWLGSLAALIAGGGILLGLITPAV